MESLARQIVMGVRWSGRSHKSKSPFCTISKIPWLSTFRQRVNDTHHIDPILKDSFQRSGRHGRGASGPSVIGMQRVSIKR